MAASRILLALVLVLGAGLGTGLGGAVPDAVPGATPDSAPDPAPGALQAVAVPSLAERLQQEALAAAERATASRAGSRTFRVLHPPTLPYLKPGQVDLELSHLSKADATGPFFVVFKLIREGRPAGFARVDLEGRWTGRLLKARRPLARLAVPGAEDLEEVEFVGIPPAGALLEFPEGHRIRNPIQVGHVLTQSDIQAVPVIKAGDQVRVSMVCGPLSVSLAATARSSAALGEKVRLELPGGRKPLMAVATAPGQAQVEWKGDPS